MPVIMPSTGGYQGPEIEDDTYVLTVRGVTVLPSDGKPDNFGKIQDRLRVKFEIGGIEDENGEPVYVDPMMNLKLSDGGDGRYPPSTFYKLCIALGLDAEQISYGVNSDDLVNLQCKGTIVTGENGWPRVTQYMRMPKGSGRNGSTRAQERPQPSLTKEAEVTAWFRKWTSKGHERAALVELSEGMFDGRAPGDLDAAELEKLEAAIV